VSGAARWTSARSRAVDLAGDPGLERTRLAGAEGPYVGAPPPPEPPARMAEDAALDRLCMELYRGFGPQRWWPAETPFEVIAGAVLVQNTSWRNATHALAGLRAAGFLTPAALLRAADDALLAAVRPSGTYRAKARKLREVSRWYLEAGGLAALATRPLAPLRDELCGVWGIGPETADSILCYAAGRRTVVVDAYARRILSRHGLVAGDLPYEELRSWLAERLVDSLYVLQEFHALCVRAGYDHCKPRVACETCPATSPADPTP